MISIAMNQNKNKLFRCLDESKISLNKKKKTEQIKRLNVSFVSECYQIK